MFSVAYYIAYCVFYVSNSISYFDARHSLTFYERIIAHSKKIKLPSVYALVFELVETQIDSSHYSLLFSVLRDDKHVKSEPHKCEHDTTKTLGIQKVREPKSRCELAINERTQFSFKVCSIAASSSSEVIGFTRIRRAS